MAATGVLPSGGSGAAVEAGEEASAELQLAKFPVDVTNVGRPVALIKLTDVLAEVLASAEDNGAIVADIVGPPAAAGAGASASEPHMAGRKRSRTALELVLRKDALARVLGPEAAARTPQRYFLQPLVGSGVRVMSSSPATGYSFVGTVTQQAVATPDMDHPSFAAFMRHRKQLAKEVEAKKKVTKLAGDGEMHSSLTTILRSNPTPEQLANMRTLIPGETRMYAPPPMRANNIFEMFERSAYWTMRDIVACTGGREADLREEVRKYCDYIRRGIHLSCYRLKPEYRTVRSARPDPDDGIVRGDNM